MPKASKILMSVFITACWMSMTGCGSPIDTDGYCEKRFEFCDDVGDKYCEIEGDEEVALKQCKISMQAQVDMMTNNKPDICSEMEELYAAYVDCLVNEADCDKWMGKDRGKDDPECDNEMEDIEDFWEDHPSQDCGPGDFYLYF